MQTMASRYPITNSSLTAFNFAGFHWPRYVATLPEGSKVKRLERYSSPCGPYYHAPKPVARYDHGQAFYLESAGMPGLRWKWCDEVEGVRIDHTGWFTDEHGCGDKIRGVVFTLPKGRGYLSGWSMGEGMASGVDCGIYSEERDAANAADDKAKRLAEEEQDYQERVRAEEEQAAEVDTTLATDQVIEAAANETDLDASCLLIQQAIGQTDGGVAGIYFSVIEPEDWPTLTKEEREEHLRNYLELENWKVVAVRKF